MEYMIDAPINLIPVAVPQGIGFEKQIKIDTHSRPHDVSGE
jgi:hypothetical protein